MDCVHQRREVWPVRQLIVRSARPAVTHVGWALLCSYMPTRSKPSGTSATREGAAVTMSSLSHPNGNDCVEVFFDAGVVHVRDSKDHGTGPAHCARRALAIVPRRSRWSCRSVIQPCDPDRHRGHRRGHASLPLRGRGRLVVHAGGVDGLRRLPSNGRARRLTVPREMWTSRRRPLFGSVTRGLSRRSLAFSGMC